MQKLIDLISEKVNTERQEYPTDLIYVNISVMVPWRLQRSIGVHHL